MFREKLDFILESIIVIEERTQIIINDDDFINSKNGLIILDAVTMRQAIGESFNQIKKEDESALEKLNIETDPIIGFRNFISHHYELLDYQIIYKICVKDLPLLKREIENYLNNSTN